MLPPAPTSVLLIGLLCNEAVKRITVSDLIQKEISWSTHTTMRQKLRIPEEVLVFGVYSYNKQYHILNPSQVKEDLTLMAYFPHFLSYLIFRKS